MVRAKTDKPADDGAPKKVNGLTKPMTLSPALAAIVGAKKDEKLARSEIVKRLWAYLKEKNLQDPENKQWFAPG
jgi:upstream activation factor subunit UAF30